MHVDMHVAWHSDAGRHLGDIGHWQIALGRPKFPKSTPNLREAKGTGKLHWGALTPGTPLVCLIICKTQELGHLKRLGGRRHRQTALGRLFPSQFWNANRFPNEHQTSDSRRILGSQRAPANCTGGAQHQISKLWEAQGHRQVALRRPQYECTLRLSQAQQWRPKPDPQWQGCIGFRPPSIGLRIPN
jgi:hypothetical protein